jgi:Zn-dependent peptidase ImmA (M78 family)/DNA-binding XRE family transcriptional regulator
MSADPLATNLRRTRVARGLSQTEVAERADLSRVAYRNIETGTAKPRVDTLMRISGVLGVRIEELLVEARTLMQVRFRAHKNRKMATREDVLVRVARWLDDYRELEELLGERPRFDFEGLAKRFARQKPSPERAIRAAEAAREALGLEEVEAIRDVCGLLEDHGIKIYPLDLASVGFFGLSVSGEDGGPAIVVNVWERITVERWIFTAAHELGHLLLHLGAYDVSRASENEEEEEEADVFASHFLMPEKIFRKEWEPTDGLPFVDRVLKVKHIFAVSCQAVLHRAFPDDKDRFRRFSNAYRAKTGKELGKKDEPQRLPEARFKPDRRDRLVRAALKKGEISLSRAAEILGITVADMRDREASW